MILEAIGRTRGVYRETVIVPPGAEPYSLNVRVFTSFSRVDVSLYSVPQGDMGELQDKELRRHEWENTHRVRANKLYLPSGTWYLLVANRMPWSICVGFRFQQLASEVAVSVP